jgi:glutathione-specific gamma-glutamylcyclotransferase
MSPPGSPKGEFRSAKHEGTPVTTDAFRHLPALRERITPAQASELRVTPELLAAWDERARHLGRPADWRLSDQELEASHRAMLGGLDDGIDLWIYSYGSLMWDPGFHFDEVRLADLQGHRRRFLFRTTLGRGSPEQPGLMLSLERGPGLCRGLAFRIPVDARHAESACVWRREMIRGSYRPALLPVATPQGEVLALVFAANQAHPDHVGDLPMHEAATMIARAAGFLGTNRQYLEQLAVQLHSLGIEDDYVAELLRYVQRAAPV